VDENTGGGGTKKCTYGQTHPKLTAVTKACSSYCSGGQVSCPTISCKGQWSTNSFNFSTCKGGSEFITGSSASCCKVGSQSCNCPGVYH
jgi:hypothetical protein